MQSVQITRGAPRRCCDPNLLFRAIFRNAYPGEYIRGLMCNGLAAVLRGGIRGTGPPQGYRGNGKGRQRPVLSRKQMFFLLLIRNIAELDNRHRSARQFQLLRRPERNRYAIAVFLLDVKVEVRRCKLCCLPEFILNRLSVLLLWPALLS